MTHAAASTADRAEAVVRVAGLAKSFGAVRALDGVSCALAAGTLTALIGGNGSGKSTLLRLLFGILAPEGGTAAVLGLDPRADRVALRRVASLAGQAAVLDPEMTGRETLRLFYALRGLPPGDRAARLATLSADFGLAAFADRRVAGYSGGQRQRLHLALALLHAPRLVLLDEPTASLDPEGRRALWGRLRRWRDEGRTLLLATHDLAGVAAHADRVLLLHEGRLLADATPAALVAAHALARVVLTLDGPPGDALVRALAAYPSVEATTAEGRTLTLILAAPLAAADLDAVVAAHDRAVTDYARHAPDLAGAYFRLTGTPWADGGPKGGAKREAKRQGGRA